MLSLDIKPLNRYILVRKCVNDHIRDDDGEVLIWRCEADYETTNWNEVIKVSEDCEYFTEDDVGKVIMCPEFSHWLHRYGMRAESECFFIKEDCIMKEFPFIVEV